MAYRVLLYGTGNIYHRCFNSVKYFESKNEIEVIGLMSGFDYTFNVLDGYKVYKLKDINNIVFDYIVVMNERNSRLIVRDLLKMGVKRDSIISYKVFQFPHMNWEEYIRLKDSKISIISNNCWGGIAYNTLGLECLSPFKNMFLKDLDYIKLLGNIREYCKNKLEFDSYDFDIHSKQQYPKMRLGDIFIHCNHEVSKDSAIENWNRRVAKINFDNLFVEMYTEKRDSAEAFDVLPYDNKICFVPFDADRNSWFQLFPQEEQEEFWEAVNSNAGMGKCSYAYNLLKLLSGKCVARAE